MGKLLSTIIIGLLTTYMPAISIAIPVDSTNPAVLPTDPHSGARLAITPMIYMCEARPGDWQNAYSIGPFACYNLYDVPSCNNGDAIIGGFSAPVNQCWFRCAAIRNYTTCNWVPIGSVPIYNCAGCR